jgi:hypothetical protein
MSYKEFNKHWDTETFGAVDQTRFHNKRKLTKKKKVEQMATGGEHTRKRVKGNHR